MSELDGVFEPGEYGYRDGMLPRKWHNEAIGKREELIRGHGGGQHIFNLYAGTGAGKTDFAGMVAADDLNLGRVRRVVVCVPTNVIAGNMQESFRERFGIHLAIFGARKYPHGVTSNYQGYIVTYSAIGRQAPLHLRISSFEPTLAIFDEVHHLGEGESWGEAAQLAMGKVPYVVTMSGSPIRPKDGGFIPFASYIPSERPDVLRYAADYSYTLGRAIVDGYCREPDFRFSDDADVLIRPAGTDREIQVNFRDKVSDFMAQLRLSAAVQYGSPARRTLLARALAEIRAAGRKVIIFLGGDTADAETPTKDATELLPGQLEELGYGPDEIMVVTQRTKRPHDVLKQFRKSATAWILVTVNMVSEGANVPELSAAIFLTTWTSDLSFIQRVGRALRFMGPGDHPDAWFYLFYHPSYHAISVSIKEEIKAEAAIRVKRQRQEGTTPGNGPPRRTEAIAINGGEITYTVWNGEKYPAPLFYEAMRFIDSHGLSKAFLSEMIDKLRKDQSHGDDGNRQRLA